MSSNIGELIPNERLNLSPKTANKNCVAVVSRKPEIPLTRSNLVSIGICGYNLVPVSEAFAINVLQQMDGYCIENDAYKTKHDAQMHAEKNFTTDMRPNGAFYRPTCLSVCPSAPWRFITRNKRRIENKKRYALTLAKQKYYPLLSGVKRQS